jgi:hypothetical protein
LSLMPTPTVDDAHNVTRNSGEFQSLTRMALSLLPTPTSQDGSNVAGPSQQRRNSKPLNAALLPTPRAAADKEHGLGDRAADGRTVQSRLNTATRSCLSPRNSPAAIAWSTGS